MVDPITLTIVLSAVGGYVAGKKGIVDGIGAANTAITLEKGIQSLESSGKNQQS